MCCARVALAAECELHARAGAARPVRRVSCGCGRERRAARLRRELPCDVARLLALHAAVRRRLGRPHPYGYLIQCTSTVLLVLVALGHTNTV